MPKRTPQERAAFKEAYRQKQLVQDPNLVVYSPQEVQDAIRDKYLTQKQFEKLPIRLIQTVIYSNMKLNKTYNRR